RFRSAGIYPGLDAPSFSQHGGSVPPGFTLRISGPVREGRVYYTLDGSDPRISANPVDEGAPITLVEESAPKTVHVPATATDRFVDDAGKAWTE
ncbi:MAG: hypothetical protein GWO24_12010, partial [Akkermansiaceae bacterium]|nr:hypothetical protein [Akkermansiaceae bacterium]